MSRLAIRPLISGRSLPRLSARQLCAGVLLSLMASTSVGQETNALWKWEELPAIPDELGFAGPFAGVHNDALIVAGGANFPRPVWDNDKKWHDRVFVMRQSADGRFTWKTAGQLNGPRAYGAAVSTPQGVLCMGGNDGTNTLADCFLMQWDPEDQALSTHAWPKLPRPCAYGAATLIDDVVYFSGGQSDSKLKSAMNQLWALDLGFVKQPDRFEWKELPSCPGPTRAFNLTVGQHNGYENCVYVISGRRQNGEAIEFLRDVWEFSPKSGQWRQRADVPRCVMAGTGIAWSQSHILVPSGADGTLFHRTDELRDQHPGFPQQSLMYHTITDTWVEAGPTPANRVTTIAVKWQDAVIVPSGEVRPRVRSPKVHRVVPQSPARNFGWFNYSVLVGYLLAMLAVGCWFARRNRTTDDYFRGGKKIPWWAAGCSIFATMLSSLTYTGLPSKAFAQDWVYAVGGFMIPLAGAIAVYVALPFFRRIDATSAYEYLELRFNRPVRLFGSASFTLFHIFRMAVVMSLTGLALAVAVPLTAQQSVLVMGALSIIYCTLGGIEAVVWTDTFQTFVLFGGALLAFAMMVAGTDGGATGFVTLASDAGKFDMAHFHFDPTSANIAVWFIIVGAIGQNISSYTADQAVVQRYMTTSDERLAARSIWTNAFLTIPATCLFFGIGTALYAFYRSHPERLDPTMTTDQIFPLFIAREMPVGLAGLIVAGVFAAAQSTVSTSMNSTATAIVTDFLRPFNMCQSEKSYLNLARILTVIMGILGTALGLIFVDPNIKSLFDTSLAVIGIFMGVLGGLFVLGAMTTRANATGAMTGALSGAATMFFVSRWTAIQSYLYTAIGITSCVLVGYAISRVTRQDTRDLSGLTVHTR